MVYKIAGGIGFILLAIPLFGIAAVPAVLTGVVLLVAGIALIAGV